MRPKLLFFAPNHFDIDKLILKNIIDLNQYDITVLENKDYKYKNLYERTLNFVSKLLFKNNLKVKFQVRDKYNEIKGLSFDKTLIIRPDLIHVDVLKKIKSQTQTTYGIYWDSFTKIPELVPTIPYFDKKYSFDSEDCLKYDLIKNDNFYVKNQTDATPDYDLFYFGSFDNRISDLEKIFDYLKNRNLKLEALIHKKRGKIKDISTEIKVTKTRIPFEKASQFTENTKIVIDLAHPNQKGLSMRPYEALGLKRKLITTNKEILNCDFYNPNNIFLINDINNINIPEEFFKNPYENIPEEIYLKYHISNWLKNILD